MPQRHMPPGKEDHRHEGRRLSVGRLSGQCGRVAESDAQEEYERHENPKGHQRAEVDGIGAGRRDGEIPDVEPEEQGAENNAQRAEDASEHGMPCHGYAEHNYGSGDKDIPGNIDAVVHRIETGANLPVDVGRGGVWRTCDGIFQEREDGLLCRDHDQHGDATGDGEDHGDLDGRCAPFGREGMVKPHRANGHQRAEGECRRVGQTSGIGTKAALMYATTLRMPQMPPVRCHAKR